MRLEVPTRGAKGPTDPRVNSLRPSAGQVRTRARKNAARKAGSIPKPPTTASAAKTRTQSVSGATNHSDATVKPDAKRAARLASS
jgi:hypothetical protein